MAENDLSASLSKLLEDPESLSRIMGLAGTLMNSMPQASQPKAVENDPQNDTAEAFSEQKDSKEEEKDSSPPDLSALPGLLEKIGNSQKTSDPRCALLSALKPYMAHGRAEKIDSLIKLLKLSELAGGFLRGGNL